MPKLSFFKTFFSAAIVEAALVVFAVYRNYYEFDFTRVFTWAVLVCIPVLVGLVAMVISLIQNAIHHKKKHHVAEKNNKSLMSAYDFSTLKDGKKEVKK